MHFVLASEAEAKTQFIVHGDWLRRALGSTHWGAVPRRHGCCLSTVSSSRWIPEGVDPEHSCRES